MDDYNNIKVFSAADIERYWKGQLSPADMHALEKAAMDDPFLADALEGYQYAPDPAPDLHYLKKKLDERTGNAASAVVIKQRRFPWLRIAAAIVIVAGLGVLAQQLFFKPDEEQIANVKTENRTSNSETNPDAKVAGTDSLHKYSPVIITPGAATTNTLHTIDSVDNTRHFFANTDTVKAPADDIARSLAETKDLANKERREIVSGAPPAVENKKAETYQGLDKKIEGVKTANDSVGLFDYKDSDKFQKQRNQAANAKKANEYLNLTNSFGYRVVDAQNNPVPFTNVLNTRDNVGTYTDIKGNFNLISSDSVLDVQLRAHGYETRSYKLVPSKQQGDIVLQEDAKVRNDVLAKSRQVVSTRAREETAEIEEPEDGWGFYNTYVENNINIPRDLREKKTGAEVELSFSVDKNGQPTNIKITKSSDCKECDAEAVRLLKDGPKWKRKGKKSKTTISFSVDK